MPHFAASYTLYCKRGQIIALFGLLFTKQEILPAIFIEHILSDEFG